jgi:hypothetical protein
VVVRRPSGRRRLTLTADDDTTMVATLADGVEVEVLAWRPAGADGPRYRVRCSDPAVEGWLGGANLALAPAVVAVARTSVAVAHRPRIVLPAKRLAASKSK